MIVYLGSDHVVKFPSYLDLSSDGFFHCFTTEKSGKKQACQGRHIGVLNSYSVQADIINYSSAVATTSDEIVLSKSVLPLLNFENASFVENTLDPSWNKNS